MTIKLLTEPTVTLIARPQFIQPPHIDVAWAGPGEEAERLAEFAGRLCYLSYHNPSGRTTREYLSNILQQGHGSVLEHAVFVFLVEGISRTCSHELVRHRAGMGYSQVSQRYVDSGDTAFVLPPAFEGDPALIQLYREHCRNAQELYETMVDINMDRFKHITDKVHRRKVARESARAVLPNGTETKIVVSGNCRAWRTVLELRCGEGAEREIRRAALKLLALLQIEVPSMFADFELYTMDDGTEAARVRYHKV